MRIYPALLVSVYLAQSALAQVQDGNLVEYSYGGFAEGAVVLGPMLLPPMVKVYQDGRIVFLDDRGVWQGQVPPRQLARFKSYLATHPLLQDTRLIPINKGASPGFHGGMAYIRYLDGDHQIVIGAMRLPSSGPWYRLVGRIRSLIPSSYRSFVPDSITVSVLRGRGLGSETIQWPFESELPLAVQTETFSDRREITNPKIVAFLLQHASGGFSWLQCIVLDHGQTYSLHVSEVPGWFKPSDLELILGALAYDEQKRP